MSLSIQPASVWRLDETSGTLAEDSQGVVDGTHGPTVVVNATGQIVKAITFDAAGFDSHTDFGDVFEFELTDTWSVSCWIKYTAVGAFQTVCGRMINTGTFRGWRLTSYSASPALELYNDYTVTNLGVRTTATFNDNLFHHVVATYDGSGVAAGVKLYVDGVIAPMTTISDTLAGTIVVPTAQFLFGAVGTPANNSERWPGTLDDVAVFEGILTADDVEEIYANGLIGVSVAEVAALMPATAMGFTLSNTP